VTAIHLTDLAAVRPGRTLDRGDIARTWGGVDHGTVSVAGPDEDAVTLAHRAASALREDLGRVATVILARPSRAVGSGDGAAVVAAAAGLPRGTRTLEVGGSERALTSALMLAHDLAQARPDDDVLVVGAEDAVAEAGSDEEGRLGHGAVAALVGTRPGVARFGPAATSSSAAPDVWLDAVGTRRTAGDRFLAATVTTEHLRIASDADPALSVAMADAAAVHVGANDPRARRSLASRLAPDARATTQLLEREGAGVATAGLLLAEALPSAQPGEVHIVVGIGSGVDLLALEVTTPPTGPLVEVAADPQLVPYGVHLRSRDRLVARAAVPDTSAVPAWRDLEATLGLIGHRCLDCDEITFPGRGRCRACGGATADDGLRLVGGGEVVTFTTDHLVAGVNPGTPESPTTMVVVQLDAGARVFLPATHGAELAVGDRVRTVLRLAHLGGGFRNYHWRVEPVGGAR
jgi:hydroxymethylglutaryl-CoA synthase